MKKLKKQMKPKIAIILQARTGSKRFPSKVLKKIQGKYMITQIISRLKTVKKIDKIILATTKKQEDKMLLKIAKKSNIEGYSGFTNDVLERYYRCAKKFGIDIIIRITGDCPLIDPRIIDKCLDIFLKNNFDYVSHTIIPTFPDGLDVEIFSFKTLEIASEKAKWSHDREHVTPFITTNSKLFKIFNIKNNRDFFRQY